MRAVSPLPVLLFLSAALLQAAPAASQEPPRRPVLFKDSRGEIAHARVRGEADILLVIASMPGRNAEVASTGRTPWTTSGPGFPWRPSGP